MYPNLSTIAYNSVIGNAVVGGRMDTEKETEISVASAAERIGVSEATLSRAARLGRLEAKKIGNTWVTTEPKAIAWKEAFYNPRMKRK